MAQRNPKNPVLQFYTNDWLNDPALKLCGYAAKGLWMDCLSLAATCIPFGHLSVDGRLLTPDDLQVILPGNHVSEEIAALLNELIDRGAASRTAKGVIYSRRMVRDARKSAVAKNNGKKGGNPSLRNKKGNPDWDNPEVKPGVNPNTFTNTNKNPLPLKKGFSENSKREKGTNPRAQGMNPRAFAAPSAGGPPWGMRVSGFRESGWWLEDWGPKPGEAGCLVPTEFL